LKANFIQGQRVTDEAAVKVVEQVLSREINPELVKTIGSLGGKARGFSGTDIFTCRKLWLTGPDGGKIDIGFVGDPTDANHAALEECLRSNIIPIISPTARGEDGKIYNCNADVAATRTAIALKARRLVFMSDVPGLLRNPKDEKTLISRLRASEVTELKRAGVIDRGMIPKVDSAVAALQSGVEKVSFVDGRVPHVVLLEIFTDQGVGTEIVF
jgi:acetylglutamate kinase